MRLVLPMFCFLAACPASEDPATDSPTAAVTCTSVDTRTYDTAADPSLYTVADPGMGISNEDVRNALLGSFVGTFTPDDGSATLSIDVAMSVDGVITVEDFERDDTGEHDADLCPSTWSAPLVFAMSSEQVGGEYVIDDLWSPTLTLTDLTTASLVGDKPAADFDGTLEVSGTVAIDATFDGGTWTGTLEGDAPLGTWSVDPE